MLNGQWIANYDGSNQGLLVVELDDRGTRYEGTAFAYDSNPALPAFAAFINTPDKAARQNLTLSLFPIDKRTLEPVTLEQFAAQGSGVAVPRFASATIAFDNDELSVEARTDIGTHISCRMLRSRAAEPSEYKPLSNLTTWKSFKEYVTDLPRARYIFRGQTDTLRLRTSFHRSGRADISRFQRDDVPNLYRHLTSRTKHVFDLAKPDEYGAFLNLIQHHGYPTPLLDWTYSPFVAAFFAYRHAPNDPPTQTEHGSVRIFVFDRSQWMKDRPQIPRLRPYGLHLSVLEFVAIENERLVPQQSVSTVTNIDDIETYIKSNEQGGDPLLQIIDLEASDRPNVMHELAVMGITAGSLFPGLDGACEELKERFFLSGVGAPFGLNHSSEALIKAAGGGDVASAQHESPE
jgi:hypothetical protein